MAIFCLLVAGIRQASAQKIDANVNGMSDVWEWIYSSYGINPSADTDGDGATNALESIAGTNPFDFNSAPRITNLSRTPTNFTVSIGCALGKQYSLQSIAAFDGLSNWITEASIVARTGTVVTLTAPAGITQKFFRIGINDVDTDGDGVNDWEEYKLGLDPLKASSNGQLDSNGQPMGDFAYAAGKLASQNVVTVTATDPSAIQPDVGQSPADFGTFTVTRGGFPLNNITVNVAYGSGTGFAASGVDHLAMPGTVLLAAGASSKTVTVTPLANTNRIVPAVAMIKINPGAGYTIGAASNANCTIYPSQSTRGTGLTGSYYTNSSATYSSVNNFNPANLRFTRVDTNVNFTFSTSSPFANNGNFCVRWTGQVQPQNTELYYFVANTDDGVKLWVNDQLIIDSWIAKSASDVTGTIYLQGGVRYNIKMEYYQGSSSASASLSWYSPSQAKQIIPTSRLYPNSAASIVYPSALSAYGFLGVPFSLTVAGTNSATGLSASGVPPGLSFNPTNAVLSGTPLLAGTFQIMITASNSVAAAAEGVSLTIFNTGSSVVREIWTNAPGVNISDIPLTLPPSSTALYGGLEGITDFGNDYAERIRGYFIPTNTGNYYFWIAGSDAAELWISNDGESVNKVKRAWVMPTFNGLINGTPPRQWTQQPNQKSGWLTLSAGQPYYIEILHKAGVATNDNWSVAWRQDSTGTNTTPGGVIPSYVLSPYFAPPPSVAQGTLYVASMLPATGVTNMCFGSASLRMNADNTRATLTFSFSGISSTVIGEHINNDPFLSNPSQIMYDISAASPQPDGSYLWNIGPVGTLSTADVLEVLNEEKGYINILTLNFPDGELVGHFEKVDGSSSFTPPAAPPVWTDDHNSAAAASRFLIQSTFGPSPSDVTNVQSIGYSNWIANQLTLPATHHLDLMLTNRSSDPTLPYPGNTLFNDWWQISTTAPDQLRQRMAFALSEIMVVSDQGVLQDNGRCTSDYYDTLLDNAFGNFRDLLEAVTLTPAMGLYLNMQGNAKGSITAGTHANENYAREIMQLFSIGLYRKWPDGTLIMDSTGNVVPTYGQNEILGFAQVFTGWNYHQALQGNGRLPTNFGPSADYIDPMTLVPNQHDLNTKLVLDNVVLPPAWGTQADSSNTNFDTYCSNDLELGLDSIFYNQNVGPFICRELIQRLVTSQPSPGYLYRVVQKFNDNGNGVRGDMQAVLYAILLDYEARSSAAAALSTFGKQREPLLRVTGIARALPAPAPLGGIYTQTNVASPTTITVATTNVHRLGSSGDTVDLTFTDTSGKPTPPSQSFGATATGQTTFTFGAPGLTSGTYTQKLNVTITNTLTSSVDTTNVIYVTISSHGLAIGQPVWLNFVSGGAISGSYVVISSTNGNNFAVETADSTANYGGNCLISKMTGGGYVVAGNKTNLTYTTSIPHGLSIGDYVYINFPSVSPAAPPDQAYQVVTVSDATHFTCTVPTTTAQTQNSATIFPVIPAPFPRSGDVLVQYSTYILNATDTGSTLSLQQTPLNSPTVFNFFFPDYKYPGVLTTAGLSTPEFQLTSDTTVAWQMNFLQGGILVNNNNTNGITSYNSGGGAIAIDVFPYMTASYASNAGLPSLVDALNSLLCGGQLSAAAKTQIVNYASTLAYTSPTPTITQLRDRVRAVVHLIVTSPDYTVQR